MAIHCPKCGSKHDVTEFPAGQKIRCQCGLSLDLSLINTFDDFVRYFESEEERNKAKEIQHDAQIICQMILDPKSEDVDIQIAKDRLREKVERLFPDKMSTYELIYESRFQRIWDQFRDGGPASG